MPFQTNEFPGNVTTSRVRGEVLKCAMLLAKRNAVVDKIAFFKRASRPNRAHLAGTSFRSQIESRLSALTLGIRNSSLGSQFCYCNKGEKDLYIDRLRRCFVRLQMPSIHFWGRIQRRPHLKWDVHHFHVKLHTFKFKTHSEL